MSIVSEIKCARCDRKYSGVRSRCPYCGARRIGRGKYTEDADNTKGKMLISVLIMGVLVVAAGVLLLTTPIDADAAPPATVLGGIEEDPPSSGLPDIEGDITSEPGRNLPTASIPDEAEENDEYDDDIPEDPPVRSVGIFHNNNRMVDFTEPVHGELIFNVRVEPLGISEVPQWSSSNEAVFEVTPLNLEQTQARLVMRGTGTATLTVSVGGVEATCIVRVSR